MPELPEVEILVRHLAPLLQGKTIRAIHLHRQKSIRPDTVEQFSNQLTGAVFHEVTRRAKFLVFELRHPREDAGFRLLGHLGMTGRMYLQSSRTPLPKHAAVTMDLGRETFVFEDTRYFGRMTTHLDSLALLGPEPLSTEFTPNAFHESLKRSKQAIKVKLLDQTLVAGIGNIYASEALFRSGISPRIQSRRLTHRQAERLHGAIRTVLGEAIDTGSTIPLDFAGAQQRDALFYYGSAEKGYEERLLVYDREGKPCVQCGTPIQRLVQAARSTYYCRNCQRSKKIH